MHHSATVPAPSALCTNANVPVRGRKVHPVIARIEGHVENLLALIDDAELFERGSATMHVLVERLDKELSTPQPGAISRVSRISAAMSRLSNAMQERCAHLRAAIIPEVRRCYDADESLYAMVR